MKHLKKCPVAAGAFAALSIAAGCSKKKNVDGSRTLTNASGTGSPAGTGAETPTPAASSTIKIDGSSTVFPISQAVAEEYRAKVKGAAQVTIGESGTGGGFKKLCRGEIAIADASRPIKPTEVEDCKKAGIDYIELPVAFDGLAVVVNRKNTWVDHLTVDELKAIWDPAAQGKVMTWSQVRAGWPDKALKLFGPGVDSGTYDYFTYPAWREYFRSTRAHNTVEVDGLDQSVLQGLFLWGQRAEARCLSWEPGTTVVRVSGEHDGYTRLPDPVVHRRHLELDAAARTLVIRDEIVAQGEHEVALHFQLGEDCVASADGAAARMLCPNGVRVGLRLDPRLTMEERRGSEHPISGWISRGYHRKAPATMLVARGRLTGSCTLVSTVEMRP